MIWINTFFHLIQAISQFGVVVYSALDAGIGHDKERHLSTGLETIIETMALSSGRYFEF